MVSHYSRTAKRGIPPMPVNPYMLGAVGVGIPIVLQIVVIGGVAYLVYKYVRKS